MKSEFETPTPKVEHQDPNHQSDLVDRQGSKKKLQRCVDNTSKWPNNGRKPVVVRSTIASRLKATKSEGCLRKRQELEELNKRSSTSFGMNPISSKESSVPLLRRESETPRRFSKAEDDDCQSWSSDAKAKAKRGGLVSKRPLSSGALNLQASKSISTTRQISNSSLLRKKEKSATGREPETRPKRSSGKWTTSKSLPGNILPTPPTKQTDLEKRPSHPPKAKVVSRQSSKGSSSQLLQPRSSLLAPSEAGGLSGGDGPRKGHAPITASIPEKRDETGGKGSLVSRLSRDSLSGPHSEARTRAGGALSKSPRPSPRSRRSGISSPSPGGFQSSPKDRKSGGDSSPSLWKRALIINKFMSLTSPTTKRKNEQPKQGKKQPLHRLVGPDRNMLRSRSTSTAPSEAASSPTSRVSKLIPRREFFGGGSGSSSSPSTPPATTKEKRSLFSKMGSSGFLGGVNKRKTALAEEKKRRKREKESRAAAAALAALSSAQEIFNKGRMDVKLINGKVWSARVSLKIHKCHHLNYNPRHLHVMFLLCLLL